jgi:hypothetical protein
MDEITEHKIRDLKLRIQMAERELAATIHNAGLGAFLRAGHPTQINKAAERDRKRLEEKLEDLKSKLAELDPTAVTAAAPEPETKVVPEKKPAAAKKAAAEKPAAASKSAVKRPVKK